MKFTRLNKITPWLPFLFFAIAIALGKNFQNNSDAPSILNHLKNTEDGNSKTKLIQK